MTSPAAALALGPVEAEYRDVGIDAIKTIGLGFRRTGEVVLQADAESQTAGLSGHGDTALDRAAELGLAVRSDRYENFVVRYINHEGRSRDWLLRTNLELVATSDW